MIFEKNKRRKNEGASKSHALSGEDRFTIDNDEAIKSYMK